MTETLKEGRVVIAELGKDLLGEGPAPAGPRKEDGTRWTVAEAQGKAQAGRECYSH